MSFFNSMPGFKMVKPHALHRYILLLVLGAGVLARAAYIDQPMRYDEAISFVRYGAQPLNISLTTYDDPNNHLLNTLLVRLSTQLAGSSDEWVIRLPVFLAGVALIVAAYCTARSFYGDRVALLAAALVAVTPQIIFYATNARGYSFVALSFLLLLQLAYALRRQSRRSWWAAFAVITAAGFYAIPSMIYPFGIVCAWLLCAIPAENTGRQRGRQLRDLALAVLAAGLLTGLLYTPTRGETAFRTLSQTAPLDQFLPSLAPLLQGTFTSWSTGIPAGVIILLLPGFAAGVIVEWRSGSYRVPLVPTAIVSLVVMGLAQRPASLNRYDYRLLFFLLPLGLIIAAAGWVHLLQRLSARSAIIIPLLAAVIATGGVAYTLHDGAVYRWKETGPFHDAEAVTRLLRPELQPGDAIMCYGPCQEILYYYFTRYDLDTAYLYTDPAQANRVFVVMNYLEYMGVAFDLPVTQYLIVFLDADTRAQMGNVALLHSFETAKVYQLLRLTPAPSGG